MAVTDVRKHRASVNCLGWKPDKLIDRLVATKRQISDIFFHWQHFSFHLIFDWLWTHSNDILWRADIFATLPPTTPQYTAVLGLTVRFVCDPSCELPPCPLYGDSVGTTRTLTFHIKDFFIVYKPLTRLHKAQSAPWIWILWCWPACPSRNILVIFLILIL